MTDKHPLNLIWIDLEMTGLAPDHDKIIEIATLVTDSDLNILAEGPVVAIHQDTAVIDAMDEWNTRQHGGSGVIDRGGRSSVDEFEAMNQTLDFLKSWVGTNESPMCGNSICQDRRFLVNYMPQLADYFHYRNLDVSTLKELVRRWKPDLASGFNKKGSHLAMDDIYDSIAELRYYREVFIRV